MNIRRDKNMLIIKVPLKNYGVSKSGKTEILATSHGSVRTGLTYKGRPIVVNLNAFVYPNTSDQ